MVDGVVRAHDNCNRQKICLKGWVKSGLSKAIENGSNDISILDPFFEIDPIENAMWQDQLDSFDGSIKTTYITDSFESDSDSEWGEDDGTIFEVFNIEDEE